MEEVVAGSEDQVDGKPLGVGPDPLDVHHLIACPYHDPLWPWGQVIGKILRRGGDPGIRDRVLLTAEPAQRRARPEGPPGEMDGQPGLVGGSTAAATSSTSAFPWSCVPVDAPIPRKLKRNTEKPRSTSLVVTATINGAIIVPPC